jgi:hypothetical protein
MLYKLSHASVRSRFDVFESRDGERFGPRFRQIFMDIEFKIDHLLIFFIVSKKRRSGLVSLLKVVE